MKTVRLLIINSLFLLLGFVGFHAYHHATLYEQSTASLAKKSDASGLAQGKLDQLTSIIT